VNASILHESAADAGSHGDVEERVTVAPGSEAGFGQGGDVAVVAQRGRFAELLAAPVGQGKLIPSRNLVAGLHQTAIAEHRTTKANPDPLDVVTIEEQTSCFQDLFTDPRSSPSRVNVTSFEGDQSRFVTGSHAQLQLRAANLDAKVHAQSWRLAREGSPND
jgi:hypothetical protein